MFGDAMLLLPLILWIGGSQALPQGDDLQLVHYSTRECNESSPGCNTEVQPTLSTKPPTLPTRKIDHKTVTEIKYGLVPAFLIGASSVIIVYIVAHCLYLHCYATKQIKHLANQQRHYTGSPTIVFNECSANASYQAMTPLVKYEGAYGKTELVHATPYLVCHQASDASSASGGGQNPQTDSGRPGGRNTFYFRMFAPSQEQRPSVCSADGEISFAETDGTNSEGTRASICFVPVGRSLSDASSAGNTDQWTPMHSFLYSTQVMTSNQPPSDGGTMKKPSIDNGNSTNPVGAQTNQGMIQMVLLSANNPSQSSHQTREVAPPSISISTAESLEANMSPEDTTCQPDKVESANVKEDTTVQGEPLSPVEGHATKDESEQPLEGSTTPENVTIQYEAEVHNPTE